MLVSLVTCGMEMEDEARALRLLRGKNGTGTVISAHEETMRHVR
jgi:hypothetical protein